MRQGLPAVLGLCLVLTGCGGTSPASAPEALSRATVSPAAVQPWLAVNDYLYQLQGFSLRNVGASKYDLVVMDYSRQGDAATQWTGAQIKALRGSAGGPKVLLAYLSIGEAEDYRFYWQSGWRTGNPAWLGAEDPGWPGNFRVKYWDAGWQAIIYGKTGAYLDRILAQGFDGVYLDLVDSYELYPRRATARQEMISFVKALSAYAKSKRPGFKIVPQNASDLVNDASYLAAIDGNGQEELSYGWNSADEAATPTSIQNTMLKNLDKVVAAGKLVLVVDYTRNRTRINAAYARAKAHGYVDYCTVRDLDQLIVNAGHAPD